MSMLKGYTIPSPGVTDGEYGAFGGFGDAQFAGYAASPVDHPYWEGQGIARTLPALNGYGEDLHSQDVLHSHDGYAGEDEPGMTPVIAGALFGWWLGGWKGAIVGGGAGAYMCKLPVFSGFDEKVVYLSRQKQRRQEAAERQAGHSDESKMHGFGFTSATHNVGGAQTQPEQGATIPSHGSMDTTSHEMTGAPADNTAKIILGVLSLAGVLKLAKVW